ncbi:ACT domain protein [Novipirellula galeiformis]|uniref:ACT domain protein n=1 Tax=Novipirellula galeiformis TaxID=2528004 RepID=A0A5C6CDB2_9BACT|nr:ACT domain protein [Novipirellula galeiformis]
MQCHHGIDSPQTINASKKQERSTSAEVNWHNDFLLPFPQNGARRSMLNQRYRMTCREVLTSRRLRSSGSFMTGETNLPMLLQNIQPVLQDGEFVFCTMKPATASDLYVSPIGPFLEVEGGNSDTCEGPSRGEWSGLLVRLQDDNSQSSLQSRSGWFSFCSDGQTGSKWNQCERSLGLFSRSPFCANGPCR